MNAWILCLALAIGVLVLLYFAKRKEGFEDFLHLNTRFTNQQDMYFQDQVGKEIYVNPGLKLDGLNDAFYQPDLYLAKSKDRDYKNYLTENPYNAFEGKDTMCRKARHPRDLPARAPRDVLACGWWFHPDVPSMGAYGSLDGPVKTDGLPPGGQWTWDISTAVMKEDVKFCKRITNCDLLSVAGIAGRCGFCTRLGHAVPINADGSDKYPDSQIGACGEPNKKTPDECKPPPEPIVASDGVQCGTLGRPSADNSIRLYKKEECDTLDGNWVPNGECLMKGGGSYSAACSGLNVPLATVSPRTCDPGPSGALSKECLISLAAGIGFTKAGAVLGNLYNNVPPSDTDKQAIEMLATIGISIPEAVLGSGRTDVHTASETYTKIYNAMTAAPKPMLKEAAKWLAIGTDNFDVCDIDPKAVGPFDATCLKQAFREAGCQASGGAYPTQATAAKYASMTWSEVGNFFKKTYDSMKASDATTQDKATKDCLGISYFRPPPVAPRPKQYDGYTLYPNSDNTDSLVGFADGRDASDCKARCDADPNCKAFNAVLNYGPWGGKSGCVTKRTGNPVIPFNKALGGAIHLYKKDPKKYDGYTLTANSDRGGNDLGCYTDGRSADSCKAMCDANPACAAFNDVDAAGWKGCCLKATATPVAPFPQNVGDVHFYAKQNTAPKAVCGVNSGDNIYCADQNIESSPNWTQIPGGLSNVSVSAGKLGGANSGDGIWFADNYKNASWVNAWGALVQVSQDKGVVVGVNRGDNIYYADNGDKARPNWTQIPGALTNVCISNGALYGCNRQQAIFYAANYKNPQWVNIPGGLRQISADKGVVCGVNSGDGIWCYDNGNPSAPNWFNVPGGLKWVSVRNGTLYGANRNDDIYYNANYRTGNWVLLPGKLKQVDFDRG